MTLLINIDEVRYGNATEPIKSLLRRCANIDWFSGRPDHEKEIAARKLLDAHVDAFRRRSSLMTSPRTVRFMYKDWGALSRVIDDSWYRWDTPPWRRVLGTVLSELEALPTYRSTVAELVGPPIWPFAGCPMRIVNPLIADEAAIPPTVPPEDWDAAWHLLCYAESFLHDAIAWALHISGTGDENPFETLISMVCKQVFPLGFSDDGTFHVFLG
jgi:hypothetical protein